MNNTSTLTNSIRGGVRVNTTAVWILVTGVLGFFAFLLKLTCYSPKSKSNKNSTKREPTESESDSGDSLSSSDSDSDTPISKPEKVKRKLSKNKTPRLPIRIRNEFDIITSQNDDSVIPTSITKITKHLSLSNIPPTLLYPDINQERRKSTSMRNMITEPIPILKK